MASFETKSKIVQASVVSLSAFGFDDVILAGAGESLIGVVDAAVMITWDGSDPSAIHGHPIAALGSQTIRGQGAINALKFIREDGTDAYVTITIKRLGGR